MVDFENFGKGNVVTTLSPYGISVVAKKNTKTKTNPTYSTGIAMIL